MAVAVFYSLPVNILPYLLIVGAIEPDVVNVNATDDIPPHVMCNSIHRNSPCATEHLTFETNDTKLNEIVSRWTERLRVELIMLATESHILFCAERNEDLEFEHRVTAKAVVEMLMGLHTMTVTNDNLKLVAELVVLRDLQDKVCERNLSGGDFFHRWLAMVNATMYNESSLRDEYAAKREQAALDTSRQVMPNAYYTIDIEEDYLCRFTVFREAYVNHVFEEETFHKRTNIFTGSHLTDLECEQFLFTKSIDAMVRKPDSHYQLSLLNQMYRGVLLEVALEITCQRGGTLQDRRQETKNKLFEIFQRWLNEETRLKVTFDRHFFDHDMEENEDPPPAIRDSLV